MSFEELQQNTAEFFQELRQRRNKRHTQNFSSDKTNYTSQPTKTIPQTNTDRPVPIINNIYNQYPQTHTKFGFFSTLATIIFMTIVCAITFLLITNPDRLIYIWEFLRGLL